MLLHVIDASGSEGRDPIRDFDLINKELAVFNPELAKRKMLVVANKCDLADEKKLTELAQYFTQKGYRFFKIMAPIAEGTDALIKAVAAELSQLPPILRYAAEPEPAEDFTLPKTRDFTLRVQDGVFIIEGEWLLKILEKTNPNDYESLQYFQRVLQQSGIIDALIKAGVKDGDTVSVYDIEFDYVS